MVNPLGQFHRKVILDFQNSKLFKYWIIIHHSKPNDLNYMNLQMICLIDAHTGLFYTVELWTKKILVFVKVSKITFAKSPVAVISYVLFSL